MKFGFYKNKKYKNKRIVAHIKMNAVSIICFADHHIMGKSTPLFGTKYKSWNELSNYEKKHIPANIDLENFQSSIFIRDGKQISEIKKV